MDEPLGEIADIKVSFDDQIDFLTVPERDCVLLSSKHHGSMPDERSLPQLDERFIDDIENEVLWYNNEYQNRKNGMSHSDLNNTNSAVS